MTPHSSSSPPMRWTKSRENLIQNLHNATSPSLCWYIIAFLLLRWLRQWGSAGRPDLPVGDAIFSYLWAIGRSLLSVSSGFPMVLTAMLNNCSSDFFSGSSNTRDAGTHDEIGWICRSSMSGASALLAMVGTVRNKVFSASSPASAMHESSDLATRMAEHGYLSRYG